MKLQLADIATNEKRKLHGFKVLGIFPYHLTYITTKTHIRLCRIQEEIQQITKGENLTNGDFYDHKIQKVAVPLINNYIVTGLLNDRSFSFIFKPFLQRKIAKCGHRHILNLYATISELEDPAFFLGYWKLLNRKDGTILKEV